ncbi:hypothetical protein B7463_g7582, partial [Scytalidium lignicola]
MSVEPKTLTEICVQARLYDQESETASIDVFIDPDVERRLVRKMDMYILPCIFIVYTASYLDRTNLGNAKVAGLSTDLHLVGDEFNVVASIFYVTYIVFELPLTIAFKFVGPKLIIPTLVCSWSLVVCFSGFEKSYAALLACRLILGFCEASLFPSFHLYISMFWTRQEIAKRAGVLSLSLAMSGAFGGLLAYALLLMDGIGGYAGWRWMFFIEGALTFCIGLAAYFVFPNNPETAYFLNQEEREVARLRLIKHGNYERFDKKDIFAALKSPILWLSGFMQMCADTYNFSISTFLPTIINDIGYNGLAAQYLTIPIYLIGAVGILMFCYLSDRYERRGIIIAIFGLFPIAGYATLLSSENPHVLYGAIYLIGFGSYIWTLNITWTNGNTAPHYKRATALAMNQTIGNIGGIFAGQIYIASQSPYYRTGHGVSLVGCGLAWCSTLLMWYILNKKNQIRERKLAAGEEDTGIGDESLHFKYQL